MNKKFEYKTLTAGYSITEKELNKLGNEGWELTTVVNNIMIFKREINEIIIKG